MVDRDKTTIAVVSGKGGVGKSLTAVNLAWTLASDHTSTALIDADLAQGACAVLLNHSVDREGHPEAVRENLSITVGCTEPPVRAMSAFGRLDHAIENDLSGSECIIIDAPAGMGAGVRWALERADLGLIVLVDEPTAIADAYRLCKMIWQRDPGYPLACMVNMVDSEEEAADVAGRFAAITDHFLGRKTVYAGWVAFSASVRRSVREQKPVSSFSAIHADAFRAVANRLTAERFHPLTPVVLN